jgi:hypothetical protein
LSGKAFLCLVINAEIIGGITKNRLQFQCDTEEEMTSEEEQSVSTRFLYRSKLEDEKVMKAY